MEKSTVLKWALAFCVISGVTALSASTAKADSIQMLPPLQYDDSSCDDVSGSNEQLLLAWDGAHSIKCINSVSITGYTTNEGGSLSVTNSAQVGDNLVVNNNAQVAGTTFATGGFVLPTIVPASPVNGQMWLIP